MTAAELIERLQGVDPQARVLVLDVYGNWTRVAGIEAMTLHVLKDAHGNFREEPFVYVCAQADAG
jgi:hypothetical protein